MTDLGKTEVTKELMDAVVLKEKEQALQKELEAIAQQESLARLDLEVTEKKANLQKNAASCHRLVQTTPTLPYNNTGATSASQLNSSPSHQKHQPLHPCSPSTQTASTGGVLTLRTLAGDEKVNAALDMLKEADLLGIEEFDIHVPTASGKSEILYITGFVKEVDQKTRDSDRHLVLIFL